MKGTLRMTEQPSKHHFLPVFYLKRWIGDDGRLVQFSRPYREVKPLRRHPEGIGFITRLYTVEGLAPELANEMEREFLSPVDSRAADALRIMIDTKKVDSLSAAQRIAWAAFLCSLLMRMPDDIYKLKKSLGTASNKAIPFFDALYRRIKPSEGPESAEELLRPRMQGLTSGQAMRAVRRFIGDPRLTNGIAGMEWRIRILHDACNELLTSDRPVAISHVLNATDSHLVLPIGPRTVFLAFRERAYADRLTDVSDELLATTINQFVVQNATSFIYGRSDRQLRFIENRMGTNRDEALMDRFTMMVNAADIGLDPSLVDWDEFELEANKAIENVRTRANSNGNLSK